ncbi:chemotaxis protein CheD [Pirellulaceae bacterium SH449]
MAEIGVGCRHGSLKTLLGSCLGIFLYERKLKIAGLAHVVLPDSAGREEPTGKYADTAILETIRRMTKLAIGEKISLIAKIAGGANMFPNIATNGTNAIGQQNLDAVERWLAELQIPILARHVGGTSNAVADFFSGKTGVFLRMHK